MPSCLVLCEVDWIRYHPEPVGTLSVAQVERDVEMDALGNLCLPQSGRYAGFLENGNDGCEARIGRTCWNVVTAGMAFKRLWFFWTRTKGCLRFGVVHTPTAPCSNSPFCIKRLGSPSKIASKEAARVKLCPKFVLPGCVVTLCERMLDVDMGPEVEWQSEGVSLVALQEDGFGQWHWEHLYDGPRLGGDDRALGILRGGPWCMSSYFPEGQSGEDLAGPDFTKAWIPLLTISPGHRESREMLGRFW